MAAYWSHAYPWWGGPIADPAPDGLSAFGAGPYVARSWQPPIEPLPWAWGAHPWPPPVPRPLPPWVDPAPRPWIEASAWGGGAPYPRAVSPWLDYAVDRGYVTGPAGWRVPWPTPGDPPAWAGLELSPWAVERARPVVRWRPPSVDPPPSEIRAVVDAFARWSRDLLISTGYRAEAIDKATVRDLVEAYAAASTPPIARSTASAVTATQVAEMDKDSLERLSHYLHSEKTRLDELAKLVQSRLSGGNK